MQQEIASKHFTHVLTKMINNKSTHSTIKFRIAEVVSQLRDSFKRDPSLKPMEDAFQEISRTHPNLLTPQIPEKQKMNEIDKIKEENDLKAALQLSLEEDKKNTQQQQQEKEQEQKQQESNAPKSDQSATAPKSGQSATASTVSRVKALFDLTSYDPEELSFQKGDIITVLESVYKDWWRGSLRGKIGIFPLNYVTPLKDPTFEETAKEAEKESEIFDQYKNVERLLSLLSTTNSHSNNQQLIDNEEIQRLYNQITPLRPKLGPLIEKYASKKDEYLLLNEKLSDSERVYNDLMDASVAQYKETQRIQYPPNQIPDAPYYPSEQAQRQSTGYQYQTDSFSQSQYGYPNNSYPRNYPQQQQQQQQQPQPQPQQQQPYQYQPFPQ